MSNIAKLKEVDRLTEDLTKLLEVKEEARSKLRLLLKDKKFCKSFNELRESVDRQINFTRYKKVYLVNKCCGNGLKQFQSFILNSNIEWDEKRIIHLSSYIQPAELRQNGNIKPLGKAKASPEILEFISNHKEYLQGFDNGVLLVMIEPDNLRLIIDDLKNKSVEEVVKIAKEFNGWDIN